MRTGGASPATAGPGVQEELDALASTLTRSVSLDDLEGTLLGYSIQGRDVDTARVEAILSRRVSPSVLAYQRSFGVDEATGPVRVPADPGLQMSARTCLPVRRGRTTLALLWVLDEGRALGAAETRVALACAGRLSASLAPPDPLPPVELLTSLFGDEPVSDLEQLFRARGRAGGRLLQLAVVGSRTPPPSLPPPTRTRDPGAVLTSTLVRGRRLMLIASPPAARGGPAPVSALLAEGLQWVVGHSAPFPADEAGPEHVSSLAAQAIVAADCAAVDPALARSAHWDDLGLYRRLLLTTAAADWPGPQPVPEHGRSADMLRHTLEVYLDHAGDAARSITALQIHRTTFYYRLERLSTLYGIDLDDGLARTERHIALKTRRLATARDRYAWTPRLLDRLRLPSAEPRQP